MGYFADLNISSGISNISANKRQPQSKACDSIGVDWEMREKAGEKFSAIKSQALIWFFCVYEKSKWKLMHPLRRQALSSLTLVGDLCVPIATQPPMLLSGRRKTVHHHLVALVEHDEAPHSFPHLAQKPGGTASGAGSDWCCNILAITRSCLDPCPWMDVMSAVIMGLLCQTYRAGLQNRHFVLLAPCGDTASLITMACNCGPVVLSQSQDPVSSLALIWRYKLGSQIMKTSLPPPTPCKNSAHTSARVLQHGVSSTQAGLRWLYSQQFFPYMMMFWGGGWGAYHPNYKLHKPILQQPGP